MAFRARCKGGTFLLVPRDPTRGIKKEDENFATPPPLFTAHTTLFHPLEPSNRKLALLLHTKILLCVCVCVREKVVSGIFSSLHTGSFLAGEYCKKSFFSFCLKIPQKAKLPFLKNGVCVFWSGKYPSSSFSQGRGRGLVCIVRRVKERCQKSHRNF